METVDTYIDALLDALAARDPLDVLRETPDVIAATIAGMPEATLRRPEAPGKWSVAHVIHHLSDSELIGAFRFRMILAHDQPEIPAYDQNRWVDRLHEPPGDISEALEAFRFLRAANVRLLSALTPGQRDRAGIHAERGEETLGYMLRLYAGHDIVHRRQIERILAAGSAVPAR
jgi:DinB family protein